jgi:hypothetical protein
VVATTVLVTTVAVANGPGPHGDSNGNATVGTIGGVLTLLVLLVAAVWTAHTWWRRHRSDAE